MTMDVEQALVYKLANTVGVSGLVSSRIHDERLPDKAMLPAVTYQMVSSPLETTMDETASNALAHDRIQIDAWASTHAGAAALSKAIFTALHGFSGAITNGADTFMMQACLRMDKRANNDPETGLYWISQDFVIWHGE